MTVESYFSATYGEARDKFRAAATAAGAKLVAYENPNAKGPNGETLTTDVALVGSEKAERVYLTISGTHGAEGFCGSGAQIGHFKDKLFDAMGPKSQAIMIHAINPHGFAHVRRVTEDNVDLNRNFVDFGKPLPVNGGYAEIHDWLLPTTWPPGEEAEAGLAAYREKHGARGLQRAIGLGQHAHADGMFFGGTSPTWSNRTFRSIVKRYTAQVRQLAAIDIHTGLGPYGVGERIFASFDRGVLPRAQQWWGRLTDVHDGSSTSIPMTGPIQTALFEGCPQAEQIGICLEYGTWPNDRVMPALRAEHWLHRRGAADAQQAREIRQAVKDAFYPDADDWKHAVWQQGREACLQAIEGLQAACIVDA